MSGLRRFYVHWFDTEPDRVGCWSVCERLGCKDLSDRIVCDCYDVTDDGQAQRDAETIATALNALDPVVAGQ